MTFLHAMCEMLRAHVSVSGVASHPQGLAVSILTNKKLVIVADALDWQVPPDVL